MKYTRRTVSAAMVAASTLLALLPSSSSAAIIIDVSQVGPDVVANASGSVNVAALSFLSPIDAYGAVFPSSGFLFVGTADMTTLDWYTGATGPTSLGPGRITAASSGTGPGIGVFGGELGILLPATLTPALSGTSTFTGTTLAQLGLTAGTYTWTWGTGPTADSLTINVTAVPEPHQYAMAAGLGLAGMALWRRHSRR